MAQQREVQGTSQRDNDPRWTKADEFGAQNLITKASSPIYEALQYAEELRRKEGLPDIAVSPLQGKFLALQCKLIGAKNALEVGTLAAYSTLFIASSSPEINVVSVEIDEHKKSVSEKVIAHAGLSDRVQVRLGAGIDVLPKLKEEIEAGKREKFDFTFIDADKQNNTNYLKLATEMSRSGACIIVDNVVRRGLVADVEAAEKDSKVAGSREVVEFAGRDGRLDCTMIQTIGEKNYDGFLMCVVK